MTKSSGVVLAALAVATLWTVAPAAAAPIGSPRMLQSTVEPLVETVRYRRGYGPAIGLGIAGALIGGAMIGAAQPYGYYGHPGYYGYPGYYGPAYVVAPPPYVGGGAVAYCAQRYRSYDPYSGTYLGYDGYRHPCP
ncbi:BA14K family protein [Bradyrhizobium sp.]|uniref:BA14K family protein n=1 Tax=Bradyrhizobium sp. TaxID=376 RepID=UPI002726DCC5|nr:BA14K family protein [Bradyrhizobium sp.]MDO9299097.1 BA14K family protein [Bradyrhizobium sp.]